jgi:hypothetical protein
VTPVRAAVTWLLAPVMLLASCSGEEPCRPAASSGSDCADIVFQGRSYDEWRTYRPPEILQEIGDANYPTCNRATDCSSSGGGGVGGFGTTDVWQLGRVPPERAVLGLREDTHTYVVYVAVGTDPRTLLPRLNPSRLG